MGIMQAQRETFFNQEPFVEGHAMTRKDPEQKAEGTKTRPQFP